jgi:hypothetical protein
MSEPTEAKALDVGVTCPVKDRSFSLRWGDFRAGLAWIGNPDGTILTVKCFFTCPLCRQEHKITLPENT